jgi:hypothetical protein
VGRLQGWSREVGSYCKPGTVGQRGVLEPWRDRNRVIQDGMCELQSQRAIWREEIADLENDLWGQTE